MICPEPGCGLPFEVVIYRDTGFVRHSHMACPRNADAHALCAKLDRVEQTLRTLIGWMLPDLGSANAKRLIKMLEEKP